MTNQQNNNSNTQISCQRNCSNVNEIHAIMESGDMVECNGCDKFMYRNGICGCLYTSR